jgi:Ca2+-transporting ATPase
VSEKEPHLDAHTRTVAELLSALASDPKRGLSDAEARARLERHGRNELAAERPVPGWRRFLAQFEDALVILLLVATAISAGLWAFERDTPLPYEAMAILAVVLLNATMGYVQQSRAEAAVAALRRMTAAHAHVVRDGKRQSVPAAEVVPGDVILVEEGDTIPADARLIRSAALQTAESALTGESLPVSNDTRPIAAEVVLGDRHNMIFSGTAATYGRGRAVVVATGMRTEMGKIAGLLEQTAAARRSRGRWRSAPARNLGLGLVGYHVARMPFGFQLTYHRYYDLEEIGLKGSVDWVNFTFEYRF